MALILCLGSKRNQWLAFLVLFCCLAVGHTQGIPLHKVYASSALYEQLNAGTMGLPKVAQELSIIGRYDEARALLGDEQVSFQIDSTSSEYTSAEHKILEESKSTSIVILNEAHHRPEHRYFVSSLLEGLYDRGYRYLALEAITNHFIDSTLLLYDEELAERGFPYFSPITGTYTREPEMGKLIRRAIALGFTIVGYEKVENEGDREYIQARNLYNKLFTASLNPNVVVLCGYHHVFEKSAKSSNKMMAAHLKEMTGIDPLTIYQLNVGEWRGADFDTPVIAAGINVFWQDTLDITGNSDYYLLHPSYSNYRGVPAWKLDGKGAFVDISPLIANEIHKVVFPQIASIYFDEEPASATPVEIRELRTIKAPNIFFLERNRSYRIEIAGFEPTVFQVPD